MKILSLLLSIALSAFNCLAQNQEHSPILFIYDASGSMWGQLDGKTKKDIASDVLSSSIAQLSDEQEIGLIVYGHREKSDCQDVEFLVDIHNQDKTRISSALKSITPLGKTPLAYSATKALDKLRADKQRATIILITDGIESCDGDLCKVVTDAKAEGIEFKLHIVGFGLKAGETEQLRCAAKAGDGNYYDAADASGLTDGLSEATSVTVDLGPGNFSVFTVKNGKPVDGLIKAFRAGTQEKIDGRRTYGDTVYLSLPAGRYDFEVLALENSRVEPIFIQNIQSFDDSVAHRTISFDGGNINLITLNNGEGWDCTSKVINKEGKVVGGSRTYGRPKLIEVNPGTYTVEIEGLVMEGLETTHTFENVTVEPGKTVDISHNFSTGKARIGARSGSTLLDCTVKIIEKGSGKNVAGGRTYTSASSNPKEFLLNPGTYEVVLKAIKLDGKTETFIMEVRPGEIVERTIEF